MKHRVLYCSSEVAPFSKTGGLADVAGSLPIALGEAGHEVVVMTPRYRGIRIASEKIGRNVTVRFIENARYFERDGLYGDGRGDHKDNLERFAFFCREAVRVARESGFHADIVHANEWQTALLCLDFKDALSRDPFWAGTKTLFTIHNMAYQGIFPLDKFRPLGLGAAMLSKKGLEIWGRGNLLKGAILCADALSTVSETYAAEIQTREHGCGLDHLARARKSKLHGILNGIDTDSWDPASDRALAARFDARSFARRADNKRALQREAGLEPRSDVPLFGMVARLVEQKGFDLLMQAFEPFMALGGQFVLLGAGDERYRHFFEKTAARWAGRVAVRSGFDEAFSRRIYASSDFFLVPSRFEPCGLGQMISFRYGALPIVHRTGGLADSVVDLTREPRRGNGFVFAPYSADAFLDAARRAARLFYDPRRMSAVQKKAMALDFSWKKSASLYGKLYDRMTAGRSARLTGRRARAAAV